MKKLLLVALLLGIASVALAMPPNWMPGFPMRMGTNIMLMWTPVPGASAYNLYKSSKDGDLGSKIISLPMNNHMDMNVPMDQNAFYTVKAIVGGAESTEASTVAKILGIKPLEPTKWLGHMDGEGQVTLRFDAVTGASFYNIFRAEEEAGPFNLMGSIQETKYTDASVKEEKDYFYQVSAVDKNSMESPRSPTYKYRMKKKVENLAAKNWKQVDIPVTPDNDIWGPDARPLVSPTWLATDGTYLVVSDNRGVAVFDEAGELVRDFKPPADYPGKWGNVRGIGASAEGMILITFSTPSVVRAMDPNDGSVAFEFPVFVAEGSVRSPEPRGVAEDGVGNIWVAEPVSGQVHVYEGKGANRGKLIKAIGGTRGKDPEEMLMGPVALLLYHKPTNRMYVVDPMVRYVRAMDCATMDFIKGEDGKPFMGWLRPGAAIGYMQEVRGIAQLADGSLVLTDGLDARQQVFSPAMDYLGSLVDVPGQKAPSTVGAVTSSVVIGNKLLLAEPMTGKITVLKLGK